MASATTCSAVADTISRSAEDASGSVRTLTALDLITIALFCSQGAISENRRKAVEFMRLAKAQKRRRVAQRASAELTAPAKDIMLSVKPSTPEVEHLVLYKRDKSRGQSSQQGEDGHADGHDVDELTEAQQPSDGLAAASKGDDVVSTYRFPAVRDKKTSKSFAHVSRSPFRPNISFCAEFNSAAANRNKQRKAVSVMVGQEDLEVVDAQSGGNADAPQARASTAPSTLAIANIPLTMPIPRSVTWMQLKCVPRRVIWGAGTFTMFDFDALLISVFSSNFRADDEPVLRYVPYFGDEDTTGVDVSAYDLVPGEIEQELKSEVPIPPVAILSLCEVVP